MENKKKPITKWLYWFTFAVAVISIYKLLDNLGEITDWIKNLVTILQPFIIAVIIAYLFYIPCRKIEGRFRKIGIKKKARALSILIVYAIAIICFILIIKFVIPVISSSIMDLINSLPSYYTRAIEGIQAMPEDSVLNKINAVEIIQNLGSIDLTKYTSIESITQYIKGILGIATTLFDVFVTIIVSIYILAERGEILKFAKKLCKALFKEDTYLTIGRNFRRSNEVFFKFLSSQLIDAIIVGILTSVAMSILHVKYAILLGFMIGLFNLIPYLGAVIGVAIAILITAIG